MRKFPVALVLMLASPALVAGQVQGIPAESTLNRLGLTRHWYTVVPAGGLQEQVLAGVVKEDLLALQTNRGTTFVLHMETGELVATVPGQPTVKGRAAFAVNSQSFFTFKGPSLYRFNRRSGVTEWRLVMEQLPNTPLEADEEFVFFGTIRGRFYAYPVDPERAGTRKWFLQLYSPVEAAPRALEDSVIACPIDGIVHVFPTRGTQPRLRYRVDERIYGDPVLFYGVPAGAGEGSIEPMFCVASTDSLVYAADPASGRTHWRLAVGAPVRKPLFLARNEDGEGKELYVVNERGELLCIDVTEGARRWTVRDVDEVIAVTPERVYVWDPHRRLRIHARKDGKALGALWLPDFTVHVVNEYSDRIILASSDGLAVCVREQGLEEPVYQQPVSQPQVPTE